MKTQVFVELLSSAIDWHKKRGVPGFSLTFRDTPQFLALENAIVEEPALSQFREGWFVSPFSSMRTEPTQLAIDLVRRTLRKMRQRRSRAWKRI